MTNEPMDLDPDDAEPANLIQLKYVAEDVTTLADVADRLQAQADELKQLAADGWRLTQPVDNGYVILEHDHLRELPNQVLVPE
jgi:hypothetical protein